MLFFSLSERKSDTLVLLRPLNVSRNTEWQRCCMYETMESFESFSWLWYASISLFHASHTFGVDTHFMQGRVLVVPPSTERLFCKVKKNTFFLPLCRNDPLPGNTQSRKEGDNKTGSALTRAWISWNAISRRKERKKNATEFVCIDFSFSSLGFHTATLLICALTVLALFLSLLTLQNRLY